MLEQELKALLRDAARWRAFSNLARKRFVAIDKEGGYTMIEIWREFYSKKEDLEEQEFLRIEKEDFEKKLLEYLGVE